MKNIVSLVQNSKESCPRCGKRAVVYDEIEKETFCNKCGFILRADASAKLTPEITIENLRAWDGTRAFNEKA